MRRDLLWAGGGAGALVALGMALASFPRTLTIAGYMMAPGTLIAALFANPHDIWFLLGAVAVNLVVYGALITMGIRLFRRPK